MIGHDDDRVTGPRLMARDDDDDGLSREGISRENNWKDAFQRRSKMQSVTVALLGRNL